LEFDESYWRPIAEATHETVLLKHSAEAGLEFDSAGKRVIVSARIDCCQKLFFVFESNWVPRKTGRIGKRVRLPRGRATVMRLVVTSSRRSNELVL